MKFEEVNGVQLGGGIKAVIYGQEGVGKTSLAAQFPGAVFIDCEGGTSKMNVRRLPSPTSWTMLREELEYILQVHKEKGYKTVIIDTFDWAERLALQELCAEHNVAGIESFGYGNGWQYEAEKIGKFLDFTEQLIKAGINVLLLCHAITRKTSLPEIDSEFDHWELKLGNKTTNKISPLLKEWSDMTLFLAFKTNVIATDDKGKKHKAVSCARVMYATKTAWWDAKNRFGLPESLPLEYTGIAHIFASPAKQIINKASASEIPVTLDDAKMIYPPESDVFSTPETKEERQTQLILDGIPDNLAQLMLADNIQPEEVQRVVGSKGYFPSDMPVAKYPKDFIDGWVVVWWKNITQTIKENRKNN